MLHFLDRFLRQAPEAADATAMCDQIPTPAENYLYPYSEHSWAHRRSHDYGKLFGD